MSRSPTQLGLWILLGGIPIGLIWWGAAWVFDSPPYEVEIVAPNDPEDDREPVETGGLEPQNSRTEAQRSVEETGFPNPAGTASPGINQRPGDSAMALAPVARTLETIQQELELALASDPIEVRKALALIRELGTLGTKDAITELITLLERADLAFPGKSRELAKVLESLDDPRVYPAALKGLEQLMEQGRSAMYEARGYLEIVATRGGHDGSLRLTQLIQQQEQPLAAMAAGLLHLAEDESTVDLLANLARTTKHTSQILYGLAQWESPRAFDVVLQFATDSENSDKMRRTAIRSLAKHIDDGQVEQLAGIYFDAKTTSEKRVALEAIQLLPRNPALAKDRVLNQALPVLQTALADEDPLVRRSAFSQVTSAAIYRVPDLLPALRTAISIEPDERQKRTMEILLQRIEQDSP